jgi:hypothetical protein
MYRLLAIAGENRERRRQRTHPARKRPELIARRPNEVWSWDIEAVVAAQGIEADQLTIHTDRGKIDDLQARRPASRGPRHGPQPQPPPM